MSSHNRHSSTFGLEDQAPANASMDPFAYLYPQGLQYGNGMYFGQPAVNPMDAASIALMEKQGAAFDRQYMPLTGFAKGAQTFGTIANGLAGLGSMYLGYQNMKQQKKAFEFNKGVVNTNLNNSIMDYNRRLEGQLQNRALNNGQGASWVSNELSRFSAKRS